jgi:hypothetical protein
MLCSVYGRPSARPIQDKDTKFADSRNAGRPACGNKLQRYTPPDRRSAAKIGGRWRFSDLISYFCKWFRASADGARHIYERFVTFSFTLKLRKFEQQKEM